jgi:hypothetical protein
MTKLKMLQTRLDWACSWTVLKSASYTLSDYWWTHAIGNFYAIGWTLFSEPIIFNYYYDFVFFHIHINLQ